MKTLLPYETAFYANDGVVTNKSALSILLYLAKTGYIRMEIRGKEVVLHRIKGYSGDQETAAFFDLLFRNETQVSLMDLKERHFWRELKIIRKEIEQKYEDGIDSRAATYKKDLKRFGVSLSISAIIIEFISIMTGNIQMFIFSIIVLLLGIISVVKSESACAIKEEHEAALLNAQNFKKYIAENTKTEDLEDILPYAYALDIHEEIIKKLGRRLSSISYIEGRKELRKEDLIRLCREITKLSDFHL